MKKSLFTSVPGSLILLAFLAIFCQSSFAQHWPGFRGPGGQGFTTETDLPLVWSDSTHIAWRADVPGDGWSSPIVWEDQVFLSAATDSGRAVRIMAFSLSSGEINWNRVIYEPAPLHMHHKNSYASSTPLSDGKLIYSVCGDGRVVALNMEGEIVWKNREISFYGEHGLAVSPVLFEDFVIVSYDGSGREPRKDLGWQVPWDSAQIVAFDRLSGEIRWRGSRGQSRIAHVTPAIMDVEGKPQLISAAGDVVQGFDPFSGERLWSVGATGEGVVPSVVLGDGLVFTASGWGDPAIRAIRPSAAGEAELVWEYRKDVPKIPSFVYKSPWLFTITENSALMCLNGKTGELIWRERIGGKFSASPILSGDRIYLLDEKAGTTVIEAAKNFRVVAKNNLSGTCQASMAVAEGAILIRTDQHLYCIKE